MVFLSCPIVFHIRRMIQNIEYGKIFGNDLYHSTNK